MSDREQELRAYYKTLTSCFSPALNDFVHFDANGLHHLLYRPNRGGPRSKTERRYRLELLPHVREVIEMAIRAEPRMISKNPLVMTWNLTHVIRDRNSGVREVKVIVIKRGAGTLYFLSTMSK